MFCSFFKLFMCSCFQVGLLMCFLGVFCRYAFVFRADNLCLNEPLASFSQILSL